MKCDIKTISSEPYIDLKSKKFSKKNEIIYNQTLRNKSKYNFFQKAFDFIYDNRVEGDYFEFGTHRARTFRFCLREANIKNMDMNFFAFDSFKGLPKVKDNYKQNHQWLPNMLVTDEKKFIKMVKPHLNNRKLHIIKGFYSKSLNKKLIKKFKEKKYKASLITIDCDLKESVRDSLDFALNFMTNGTILYIDDYYGTYKGDPRKGNPKVVKDLLKKHKVFYEPWNLVASISKSFLLYK